MDLEKEAARIVAEDDTKRANGGTSEHIVVYDGILSGFVKDAHAAVRFAGGAVAVTKHDFMHMDFQIKSHKSDSGCTESHGNSRDC